VTQLSDVQPQDWAYQALKSLVERYGCIVGYPDKTFRGNRPLTRYEFAAGLNACLDKMQEAIAAATADFVKKADLETVKTLQEQFAAELAALRGRVDALEVRTATLERQQFSTTTVLQGQSILGFVAGTGGNPPGLGEANPILINLTQLQLATSFTGSRDLLRIGLVAGNSVNDSLAGLQSFNTNMAYLSFQENSSNLLLINSVDYRFAVSDRLVFAIQPYGFSLSSVLSPNSPYSDSGQGALSRFAAYNPVFRIGNLDAGVGLDWLISDQWRLQLAYGARNASDPQEGLLGSGNQAFGVQFLNKPTSNLIWGLAYIGAYARNGQLDTFTGSNNADTSGGFEQPARIHSLAASLQWRISPWVTLAAWGGGTFTDSTFGRVFRVIRDRNLSAEDIGAVTLSSTYLVSLGFNDPFGRKGDQLVFMVGQPPKLNLGALIERVDFGYSLHFETYYRFVVNDNISVTPGFFYVTNPGQINENNGIFVGVIRTTFSF
jgi:hypothetical protein